ncbi:MAG TPA: TIR domain-containing protein [Tepidisphaeraceae bacterium]|jgi:WD40 repeat protein|nr:TIR domain-containing protein [Tepidisphaeraceae bacterium]
MSYDVFISYSSKDKPVAEAITAALESNGLTCWIAPRNIKPAEDFGEAIIAAISACRVMVVVFSANSNTNEQVQRELELAVNREVHITAVRITDAEPSSAMEHFVTAEHWLDAQGGPTKEHLARLTASVRNVIFPPAPAAEAEASEEGPQAADEQQLAAEGPVEQSADAAAEAPDADLSQASADSQPESPDENSSESPEPQTPDVIDLNEIPPRRRRKLTLAAAVLVAIGVVSWVTHARLRTHANIASAAPLIQVAATPAAPQPIILPAARVDVDGHRVVDLMKVVDVKRDTVAGVWSKEEGELSNNTASFPVIATSYQPPAEYNFRVEFTRNSSYGDSGVGEVLSSHGRRFSWSLGAGNETLKDGRKYLFVVCVREKAITAYLDGQLIGKKDPQDMTRSEWDMGLDELGVGSYRCSVVFHKLEVVEVSGPGHVTPAPLPDARQITQLLVHQHPVQRIQFSPDGRILSTNREEAILWDVPKKTLLRKVQCTGVHNLLSPDGSLLLLEEDGEMSVQNPNSGDVQFPIRDNAGWQPEAVAFSADASQIAITGGNDITVVRDARSGKVLHKWTDPKAQNTAVLFSPDGQYLARLTREKSLGEIRSLKSSTTTPITDYANAAAFSPDGSKLLTWMQYPALSSALHLHDVRSGQFPVRIDTGGKYINDAAFVLGGRAIVVAGDGGIREFDLQGILLYTFPVQNAGIAQIAVTPDGNRVLAAGSDGLVRLFDAATGTQITAYTGHRGKVISVAISTDGQTGASGGMDRTLRLWRLP